MSSARPKARSRARVKTAAPVDQPKATAYHEAGHAVASHALGLPFNVVHIAPDIRTNNLGFIERDPVPFPPYPAEQEVLDELEKRIIATFAGVVAETRYTGRLQWKYGSGDFDLAFRLALVRHSEGSLVEVEAFLKYLWVRTHELLKKPMHWQSVCAVAGALLESTRLTGPEAVEIIEQATEPILSERGLERSEVERLRPPYNGGVPIDTALLQYLVRRSLRSLWR